MECRVSYGDVIKQTVVKTAPCDEVADRPVSHHNKDQLHIHHHSSGDNLILKFLVGLSSFDFLFLCPLSPTAQ